MAQHDYNLENQPGASFREDLNAVMQAIVSNNSGPTEPESTYALQWWADTTSGVLKQRNAGNNDWVSVLDLSTGRPVGAVSQTSASGAVLLAEGSDSQRPAPEDIPEGSAAVRGNSTSPLDYFLELWDRSAGVWKALSDRPWVKSITDAIALRVTGLESKLGIGYSQSYVDVSSDRLAGVTYTNSSPRTITFFYFAGSGGASGQFLMTVGDKELKGPTWGSAAGSGIGITIPIPPGESYSFQPGGYTVGVKIWELR